MESLWFIRMKTYLLLRPRLLFIRRGCASASERLDVVDDHVLRRQPRDRVPQLTVDRHGIRHLVENIQMWRDSNPQLFDHEMSLLTTSPNKMDALSVRKPFAIDWVEKITWKKFRCIKYKMVWQMQCHIRQCIGLQVKRKIFKSRSKKIVQFVSQLYMFL